jgi:hypothetical protein
MLLLRSKGSRHVLNKANRKNVCMPGGRLVPGFFDAGYVNTIGSLSLLLLVAAHTMAAAEDHGELPTLAIGVFQGRFVSYHHIMYAFQDHVSGPAIN